MPLKSKLYWKNCTFTSQSLYQYIFPQGIAIRHHWLVVPSFLSHMLPNFEKIQLVEFQYIKFMDSRNNLLMLIYLFTFWFSATIKKKDNLLHMVCYEIIERFLNLEYVPKCISRQHLTTSPIYLTTRNQALQAWILEFEMFVHWICEFDPFWTDLIQKKSKSKTAILILFKDVITFYTNIFRYVQPLRSLFCRKTDTQTETARTEQLE